MSFFTEPNLENASKVTEDGHAAEEGSDVVREDTTSNRRSVVEP